MNGEIRPNGTVKIEFNSQDETLLAPGGKKYLPCDKCGVVMAVNMNVVATLCPSCLTFEASGEGWTCSKCGLRWPIEKDRCKCGMDRDEPRFPDGGPCDRRGCRGWFTFSRGCGAYVCYECNHHKGLCRCYCGWSQSGGNGRRELEEMGEIIEAED